MMPIDKPVTLSIGGASKIIGHLRAAQAYYDTAATRAKANRLDPLAADYSDMALECETLKAELLDQIEELT